VRIGQGGLLEVLVDAAAAALVTGLQLDGHARAVVLFDPLDLVLVDSPPAGLARRDLDALAAAIAQAGTGRRNNILYWAMRRATEERIPENVAAAVLGRSAIEAGLSEREVAATIRSASSEARR